MMEDYESLIYSTLERIYPAYEHGTIEEDRDYDPDFFTVSFGASGYQNYYDNEPVASNYDVMVFFYSTDPDHLISVPKQAENELKSIGLIPQGPAIPAPSDEPSHTGRVLEFKILQTKLQEI